MTSGQKIFLTLVMVFVRGNKSYEQREGSRAQVMHGTAEQTSGGLKKHHLKYNKFGRIVSKKKSEQGKTALKRLISAGYLPFKKGEQGTVRRTARPRRTRRA
jgi:hypothetical protein